MENATTTITQENTDKTRQHAELELRLEDLCQRLGHPEEELEDICFQIIRTYLQMGKDMGQLRAWIRQRTSSFPKPLAAAIEAMLKSQLVYWLKVDRLQHGIKSCVDELNRKQNDPGAYRDLVKLGREYQRQLPQFRRCLMNAGLSAIRASEVTAILYHDDTARKFADGEYSVRQALAAARANRGGAANGRSKASRALLKLIRRAMGELLDQAEQKLKREAQSQEMESGGAQGGKRRSPFTLTAGPYELSFEPAAQITPS